MARDSSYYFMGLCRTGWVWLSAICAFGETHAVPLDLAQARYEIRAGEAVEIAAQGETLDFLLSAKSRGVSVKGLIAGPNHTRDRVLLKASLRATPGEYTATLSASGANGEVRETALDVVVKPMLTVPSGSSRPPVVLLNGWEAGFTGACPVSADSTVTFGNLAQYLLNDGVPEVFFFDNCAEDPNEPVEVLGNDLATVLNSIKYDTGAQVPQIDLVGFSLGGLIARCYLAGLQTNGTYLPPASTLVRKLILIATPNFGSFVAGSYASEIGPGTQDYELEPGSSFLWNLATWNQYSDDLRGVDAIAVVGNAGEFTPALESSTVLLNASDGMVSETSAALGFVASPVESATTNTRVVPYCHVDPSAYYNNSFGSYLCNAAGIANVTSTAHLTGEIVRSFLAGTTAWSSIGTAPASDTYLSKDGAMYVSLVSSGNAYAANLTAVSWGTVSLLDGGDAGTIYYYDFLSGTGVITLTSQSLGTVGCGSLKLLTGYYSTERCKIATDVYTVTPLVSGAGRTVTAGSTVTLNGFDFGTQCNGCKVQAQQQGTTTVETLTVTSWTTSAISVKLPAGLTGLLTLTVFAPAGSDSIGIMAEASSTIAVSPASLQFTAAVGGSAPAAQSIDITNSGTGTLAWTATVSQSWMSLSASSGTAPSTPTVSVSPSGLSAGTYTGTVQIAANGASNSPVSVGVTLTVAPSTPALAVTPQSLTFQYTAGGAAPAVQTLSIANSGTGTIAWAATADSFWLSLSSTSGSTPGSIPVGASGANLAAGTYTGNVTISSSGLSPVVVPATLLVQGTQAAGTITAVVNAGGYQATIAPATWVSIFGTNLSAITYSWQSSDFVNGALPTSLQGVSVTIDGLPAYVEYISPTQINVLAPYDTTVGTVQVQVTTAAQASNSLAVEEATFSPAMLTYDGTNVAAQHADSSAVSAASPAQPGETIVIYGVGFGPANPPQPTGQLVTTAVPLANAVTFTIGGQTAQVQFAGLVGAGLYQCNVTVPDLPGGDAAVFANIGGLATQAGVLVAVQ
jgi:uncharacterized protein (TIGR03437 family)